MFKSWARDFALAIQARSGASPAFFVAAAIVVLASLTAFVFLCVALYNWLALRLDDVTAGLATAGIFVAIALIGTVGCALARRRARERAILARAARAHEGPRLLDPKIVMAVLQIGRTLGWQRVVPIALLGFIAAQWAREHREHAGRSGS